MIFYQTSPIYLCCPLTYSLFLEIGSSQRNQTALFVLSLLDENFNLSFVLYLLSLLTQRSREGFTRPLSGYNQSLSALSCITQTYSSLCFDLCVHYSNLGLSPWKHPRKRTQDIIKTTQLSATPCLFPNLSWSTSFYFTSVSSSLL